MTLEKQSATAVQSPVDGAPRFDVSAFHPLRSKAAGASATLSGRSRNGGERFPASLSCTGWPTLIGYLSMKQCQQTG
jgi:hypothetical protein